MDLRTKLGVYQKKLLDTGRRNKLIHYRFSLSSNVEVLHDDFEEISLKILDGATYQFATLFEKMDEFSEDTNSKVLACGKRIDKKDKYELDEILDIKERFSPLKKYNYLYSTSITSVLKRTLRNLKNKATVFFEENGLNVLYLAMGFLSYTDVDGLETKAPLCLIPIQIESKTIHADYMIKAIDDAFVPNETLYYKLRLENKINLPAYTDGISIAEYLNEIEIFMQKYNFKVSKEIAIGLFSFSKIKMYQDITENLDVYLQNPPLKALCGDYSMLNSDKAEVESFSEDLEVLNADASQMEAIQMAKSGKSFVLQGPPGCGKSQTITNIIGELIAQNKSVLFVCEKKAALDVVYRNLSNRNLEKFCLPLHDPKTNKKDIIDGIYQNLEEIQENRQTLSQKALDIYDTFHALEAKLDTYTNALKHKPFPPDITIFDYVNRYYAVMNAEEIEYTFSPNQDVLQDEILLSTLEKKVAKMNLLPWQHPFYGFKLLTFNLNEKDEFIKKMNMFTKSLTLLLRNQVLEQIKTFSIHKLTDYFKIIDFYEKLLHGPKNIPSPYFSYKDIKKAKNDFLKLEKQSICYHELEQKILKKYEKEVLQLDILEMLEIVKKNTSLFKFLNKSYRTTKAKLEVHLKVYDKLNYKDILTDLKDIKSAIELRKEINLDDFTYRVQYKEFYFGVQTDFSLLSQVIDYIDQFMDMKKDLEQYSANVEEIILNISQGNILEMQAEYQSLVTYVSNLETGFAMYQEYFQYKDESIEEILFKLKDVLNELPSVYDYMEYKKSEIEVEKKYPQLSTLLIKYGIDSVLKTYLKNILLEFNREYNLDDDFAETIHEYGICLQQMLDLSQIKIGELVSNSWPQMDSLMASNSEVLTLKSEANKRRKLRPLRETFAKMPNLLMDLKPCFMMSPISVATFLDPNVFQFDTVIFDEASQLTSENAIGSIARSKAVIVCGDQEQLPPTSFFMQETTDEEDLEYDVYESILDECKVVFPVKMLKWHYRSKNEALIQYSNQEIYHDLLTFKEPYVSREGQGVHYIYLPDGRFEKGKLRINRREAEKVCELVFEHFRKYPGKSLGVVTFNTTQQAYIDSLISRKRYEDRSYESFFSEDQKEPFFIKNLETVQGDERDTIILSIGYAKDEAGKLSMNFGPLNQTGGYKRLNVAITRAKEEVLLVGSIHPQDFDLSRTEARGVKMLKGYIEYAMQNVSDTHIENEEVSFIIKDLVKRIEQMGYTAHTKVGKSPIKVDIAVLNKNKIDYKLAIILDGESYANHKASKDRNYLFASVLRARGWLVYHLFSFRYLQNPEGILEEIKQLLVDGDSNQEAAPFTAVEYTEMKEIDIVKAHDLFDMYPNVEGAVQFELQTGVSTTEMLYHLILKTAPIYTEDLMRASLPFYGKSKLTMAAQKIIEADLASLIREKGIFKTGRFILIKGQIFNIKFRKHDSLNPTIREIDHIYIEEISSGIAKIMQVAKEMDFMSLATILNDLLGYHKVTQKCVDIYQRALQSLDALLQIEGGKIIYKA